MKEGKLFCCYSIPLRDYLLKNNMHYELCGCNPNTQKMFWVFIKTDKLEELLKSWSQK